MMPPAPFWPRVEKTEAGCWIWLGQIANNGYGHYATGGKKVKAHRFAYEELVGPIPVGLELDHLCRNRCCVNPEHLEPVTRQENARRGAHGSLIVECPHGHKYDHENTYVTPLGHRQCRKCKRDRERERQRRLRLAAT